MKKIFVISLLLLVTACASTTKINTSDPDNIVVTGASDELITYEDGSGIKVTSDRRGRPNIFQSLLGLSLKKAVDTEVE